MCRGFEGSIEDESCKWAQGFPGLFRSLVSNGLKSVCVSLPVESVESIQDFYRRRVLGLNMFSLCRGLRARFLLNM